MNKQNVGVILVLYKPDMEVTMPAIRSLAPQVDEICLVDNTPDQNIIDLFADIANSHYIPLGENRGIAFAQNVGIRYFLKLGFDFVLFSDQDSIAKNGIVQSLIKTFIALEEKGIKVGVVGPLPIHRNTMKPVIVKQNIRKYYSESCIGKSLYSMYSIISSFSLIKLNVFNEIGLFKEYLFIDGVDAEWCWRAYDKGRFLTILDPSVKISHSLGESNQGPIKIYIPTPFRTYYQFRNYFILSRIGYTPLWWKIKNGLKYITKYFYYPIFLTPRISYLKNMTKGIIDGITYSDQK